jgi:hypothetical protein
MNFTSIEVRKTLLDVLQIKGMRSPLWSAGLTMSDVVHTCIHKVPLSESSLNQLGLSCTVRYNNHSTSLNDLEYAIVRLSMGLSGLV